MKYLPIKSYFRYLLNRKGKYRLHSPFLYHFYKEVLENSEDSDFSEIEAIREKYLNNQELIEVSDFGAGSVMNASNRRKISYIARTSLKSPKHCRILHRLLKFNNSENIMELGTSLGITTSYLAKANPKAKIISIEGCPNIASIAKNTFDQLGLDNIHLVNSNIDEILEKTLNQFNKLDLVLFDGNHRKQANLSYFNNCLNKIHDKSVFVFDDIRWSKEMEELWEEIRLHPKVSCSIDLFDWGILTFDHSFEREHLSLRY